MPNPFEQLTNHLTTLFDGLFIDSTVIVLGVTTLVFIVFGAGVIAEFLAGITQSRERSFHLGQADKYLAKRASFKRHSAEWLENEYLARHHIRKSAQARLRRED